MATYYVDSSATGANDGSSKANAFTTVNFTGKAQAGDILLISHTHVDTNNTEVDSGSRGNPVKLISIDFSDDSYRFGAKLKKPKAGGYSLYGIHMSENNEINLAKTDADASDYSFYDCLFDIGTGGTREDLIVGGRYGNQFFKKCRFKFNNVNARLQIGDNITQAYRSQVYFEDCSLDSGTAAVTGFFVSIDGTLTTYGNITSHVEINGLDVSNANTSSFELITGRSSNNIFPVHMQGHGIKLPTNGSIGNFDSRWNDQGDIFLTAIDDPVNGLYYQNYAGNITDDLTVYRKAYTGTDSYSLKYVTSSESIPGSIFKDGSLSFTVSSFYSAANPTITVHAFGDHATILTDQEFWIEVDYPLSDGLRGFSSTLHSDLIAGTGASATATASASDWTGESGSNQRFYNPSITISGGAAGIHHVKVYLARASETLYVDPRVDIT